TMKQHYLSISLQHNPQPIPPHQLHIIPYTTLTSTTPTPNPLLNLNKTLTRLFPTTSPLNVQSSQSATTLTSLIPYKSSNHQHFNQTLNPSS
ncbi:ATP-binding protein, partial [Staphylococcus epidermidis]